MTWTPKSPLPPPSPNPPHFSSSSTGGEPGEEFQRSITLLASDYERLGEEAIFRNTIGAILAALGLLIPCILSCDAFRAGLAREGGGGGAI